jgi:hypothetical protein
MSCYSHQVPADGQDFKAGERICGLDNVSLATEKAYSSVQFGTNAQDHLELNSDLLFSMSAYAVMKCG